VSTNLRKHEVLPSPGLTIVDTEGLARKLSVSIGPMRISGLSVEELTRSLIGHAYGNRTHHLVTANAHFYVMAERDASFRRCVNKAEYVCADGVSIVLACKWLAKKNVSRVPGVDMIPMLCEEAAKRGLGVYFLGGRPGAAERTADLMAKMYPTLSISGADCPPTGFTQNSQLLTGVLERIQEAKPAIIFVALGAPLQELFIEEHIRLLGVPIAVGVGGSFEMISGLVQRAPVWIQEIGLEWAFRWAQEPRRLAKRYLLGNMLFMAYASRHFLFLKHAELRKRTDGSSA
jgi:N-acetylglucosaminyldiphosphoundecaprenol N-acetyl-beta-D-mannosaminyltransferase